MISIVLMVVALIGTVLLYNTPIIGTAVGILAIILAIVQLRRTRVVFGMISLVISVVTFVLSVIILLITLGVMAPIDINIGYDVNKTRGFNTKLCGDMITEQERIKNNISEYLRKRSADLANGTKMESIYPELFMDSSQVTIYHTSQNVVDLKKEVTDEFYDKISHMVATSDSTTEYYLINLDLLETKINTLDKVKKSKRSYWLMDKAGNVYVNVDNIKEYIKGKTA